MSRKEEIKQAAVDFCNPYKFGDLGQMAFVCGALWADEHRHWVSVEDELPDKCGNYLCLVCDSMLVLFYHYSIKQWHEIYINKEEYIGVLDLTSKVTHWMRLPSPPRKEDEK